MVDSPYPEIQRQSNLEKMPSLMRTCHSFPRIKTFRITKIITTPNSGLFFERSLSWLVVDNTAGIGSTVSMMKWSLYSTIWILDRVPRLVRIRPKNKVNKSYEIVPLIMYLTKVRKLFYQRLPQTPPPPTGGHTVSLFLFFCIIGVVWRWVNLWLYSFWVFCQGWEFAH